MNILIISPVLLLIVLQAFSVSAQYKWNHQHGYSDYQYARYDLPRFELRLPDTFNNRIFEDHFAQTIYGFQPLHQPREYVPELYLPNFQSPHDVYVEHHWSHPMLLPTIDPFRWSVQSTLSMSFKIKVPTISNNNDIADGFVKEPNPTSETGNINTDIQSKAENKPDIKGEVNKPETDIKDETEKRKSIEPGTDKPKTHTSQLEGDIRNKTDKPESVKPEAEKPYTVKPDAVKPDAVKPDTKKPDTDKSDTDKPKADKPETDIELETNKPDADIKPVTNKLDVEIKPVADVEAKSVKPDIETEKATVTDITENESTTVGTPESPKETTNTNEGKSESTTPKEDVTKSNNIESTTDKVGSSTTAKSQ